MSLIELDWAQVQSDVLRRFFSCPRVKPTFSTVSLAVRGRGLILLGLGHPLRFSSASCFLRTHVVFHTSPQLAQNRHVNQHSQLQVQWVFSLGMHKVVSNPDLEVRNEGGHRFAFA